MGAKSHTGKHGVFHSQKSKRWISVDSSYEYLRCAQLEEDDSVSSFNRCTDQIPYEHNGVIRRYNPDFEVTLKSGKIRIEEVKPKTFIGNEIVQAKAKAAHQRYSVMGIEYQVITEDVLGDVSKHIIQRGLGEIGEEQLIAIRKARKRQISRESARRVRAAKPMTKEQKAQHAAKQLERYRNWKANATKEEIEIKRKQNREAMRTYRAAKKHRAKATDSQNQSEPPHFAQI